MFLVAFAKVINLATPIKLLTHYTKGKQLLLKKFHLLFSLFILPLFTPFADSISPFLRSTSSLSLKDHI